MLQRKGSDPVEGTSQGLEHKFGTNSNQSKVK